MASDPLSAGVPPRPRSHRPRAPSRRPAFEPLGPDCPAAEVVFASVVIQAAASRMRRAFITLRKPDESIKHDSNDQEPKLHERGKEIVHRRVLRRCDIKQPTFPEKVCTAYACAEPIEEALAVPERHERNRNQRGRMQKNCPGPYPLRCGDRQHRHPRPGIVVAFGSGETPEMRRRPEEQDKRK